MAPQRHGTLDLGTYCEALGFPYFEVLETNQGGRFGRLLNLGDA